MVVRLAGGKEIVVDAKAPLEAYLNALEAPDDEARRSFLQDHARQIRVHMNSLGSKRYWDQFPSAPDFVVMFLPGESFFSAALEQDPALIQWGVDQRVIPASPTTLIALLRAVAYGWQQERIAESAQKISDLGRELYDRLCTVTSHIEKMGRNLGNAVEAYNSLIGSFESRVMVSARQFSELGAATQAQLPELKPLDNVPRHVEVRQATTVDALSVSNGKEDGEGRA